ncbi:MAG TPA: VWA domain-containing protein [Candidatus Limnocylindrales bacterium]
MQFLWPGFLLLLLLVPLLIGLYVLGRRRRRPDAVRYSSLSLIRDALPGSSFIRRHLPFALFAVALAGLAVAVARPVVIASVPTNEATIVLAIDVSGSMCSTDVAPSRIEAAEAAAANFIGSQSSSTQIGIVAFSGFAEIVQPPTTDRNLLLDALHSLQTGRRTAVGSGILAAIDAIAEIDPNVAKSTSDTTPGVEPPPVPKGDYAPEIIVLLTDGSSNAGPLPTAAAQEAADRGLRVYTIGFGTADGGALSAACAPNLVGREPGGQGGFGGGFGNQNNGQFPRGIDETALKQVAAETGGTYEPAESAAQLESVFQGLPTNLITKHEVLEIGFGFVGASLLLAGLAFILGRAWRPLP